MRIYELSKELNVPSKELITLLTEKGFDVRSHMSVLSEDAIMLLQNTFGKKSKADAQKKSSIEKPELKPKTPVKKSVSLRKKTQKKQQIIEEPVAPTEFIVEAMTLAEAAEKMGKPASELILALLRQGAMYTKNQLLPEEVVEVLAQQFGLEVKHKKTVTSHEETVALKKQGGAELRPPVVVVLGHVDHGKTTLLDFIRKTKVAPKEKGGITQHIGAYKAKTPRGNIIFVDTPGHAAFSKIRSRGVRVADIAILVVAGDDSVKPQTIEAIKHAKEADIPIVVAINKIDKAAPAQIEKTKNDLAQYDLLPEEWGGQTICVPISAKEGTGVDDLLEMISLQAEIMDLRADLDQPAKGVVLESKLERGLGPVATILSHQGVLKVGDYFSAGFTTGKVNVIIDSFGKRIKKVGPSEPVRVAGFSELPEAGDYFEVVSKEKYTALKSNKESRRAEISRPILVEGALSLILKVDTNSTKEALIGAIEKIAKKADTEINIMHAAVGNITESDVALAVNTGASLYGFHVKIEPGAAVLARKNLLEIKQYDVIYALLDNIELLAKKPEEIKYVSQKIGEATVLRVFDIKNIGVIAGCIVKEGRFSREGTVVVWRGRQKVGEGPLKSLQRERKTVKEVHAGFECGLLVQGLTDWQVDDRVECYLQVPETV